MTSQLQFQDIIKRSNGRLIRGGFTPTERETIRVILVYAETEPYIYDYAVKIHAAFENLLAADVYDEMTLDGRRNAALIREDAYASLRKILELALTPVPDKQAEERRQRKLWEATLIRGRGVVRMSKGFGLKALNYGHR